MDACKVFRMMKHVTLFPRYIHKKAGNLVFRKALLEDKELVLSLRQYVYGGLDYLPDYYEYFINDKNRECVIAELDRKPVAFGTMFIFDAGSSMFGQAGRVHQEHEGCGIFRELNNYLNKTAKENGCLRRVALVQTTLNKFARSEKIKRTHRKITSKLQFAGIVTDTVRKTATCNIQKTNYQEESIREMNPSKLKVCLTSEELKQTLFPGERILVDYIPFRCLEENLHFLHGRNTLFYAIDDDISLVSAGSSYKCARPAVSYITDVFGTNPRNLQSHIIFHLSAAMKKITGEFCLQIFVEQGYIAQVLCNILRKLDIPKCNWYIEGGVTTMTIFEEVYK